SYHQYNVNINNQIENELNMTLYHIKNDIRKKVDYVERISQNVSQDTGFKNFLFYDFILSKQILVEYNNYHNSLSNFASILDELKTYKILVYVANDTIPEGWGTFYSLERIADKKW